MIDGAIGELAPLVGTQAACRAVASARASYYRRHRRSPRPALAVQERRPQPRALTVPERQAVLSLLHDERHVDEAPATVYAQLLDEGRSLCAVPTMYRILHARDEVRERRHQATHPAAKKPELMATAPNQCWSWDIERHEALSNRAEMEGHRRQSVAAG